MSTSETLKTYINDLKAVDHKSDDQFKELLRRGIELLQLSDKTIAHEFGASRPTVTRWRNGNNAPHPGFRKHIYTWLEVTANERYGVAKRSESNKQARTSRPPKDDAKMG